jgi:hypothetical protein
MMTARQFRKALARLGRRPRWKRYSDEQMTVATQDRGSITDPAKMTPDERRDYVDTYPSVKELFTCVHGHDGCSISRGGLCLDDVLRYMEANGEMK